MNNEKNLIKVKDPVLAGKLVDMGFSYMLEENQNEKIYVFLFDEELSARVEQFPKGSFIRDSRLKF